MSDGMSDWSAEEQLTKLVEEITTPSHYELDFNGVVYEVDDITTALSKKLYNQQNTTNTRTLKPEEVHYYFAAVEYILRAPFKGTFNSDIKKAISRLEKLV